MCDYSLELYRSRPAVQEERYTLRRFPSGTMGFTAGYDCDTAVCMPADAHLRLEGIGETVQRAFDVGPVEEVMMIRLEVIAHAHRDAVRFANGKEVMLQRLNAGITTEMVSAISDLTDVETRPSRELVDA
ncbi:MAG TPA: hypothetical protein VK681_25210 [Reyranella sp.]|nr:hypothetical protein [Reyranella sp.]